MYEKKLFLWAWCALLFEKMLVNHEAMFIFYVGVTDRGISLRLYSIAGVFVHAGCYA